MKKWKRIMIFTPYRVFGITHYADRNMYSKWMIYYKVNLIQWFFSFETPMHWVCVCNSCLIQTVATESDTASLI